VDSFLPGRCSMAWSEHEKAMLLYKWTYGLRAHVYHGWYGIDGLEKRGVQRLYGGHDRKRQMHEIQAHGLGKKLSVVDQRLCSLCSW